jgi:hypothetical protein
VLYLQRRRRLFVVQAVLAGRCGYSDLKEAALQGAGLCIFYPTRGMWMEGVGAAVGDAAGEEAETGDGEVAAEGGPADAMASMRQSCGIAAATCGEIETVLEVHAAHPWTSGGERSSSCAAESRSTTCMVPPQTGQFQDVEARG